MPFIPSFTATQLYATPTILRIVDTSTGSDSNITGRKVYLRQANGSYLVPSGITTDYIDFPLGSDYIDIDVLDVDYALEIKVEWDGNHSFLLINSTDKLLINSTSKLLIS